MLRYQCGLIPPGAPPFPDIPIGKKKIFSCELESEVVFSPNPRILDAEAFHDTEQRQAIVDGALFGGLMALAWACLMLGVFGRHRVFLVLALTVTIIAGFEIAPVDMDNSIFGRTCRRGTIAVPQSWRRWRPRPGGIRRHAGAAQQGACTIPPVAGKRGRLVWTCHCHGSCRLLAAASKLALSLGGVFFLTMAAIGWMGKKGRTGIKMDNGVRDSRVGEFCACIPGRAWIWPNRP